MADKNKVGFGLEQVHIGKYTVSEEGVVALEKPVVIPGAIKLNLEFDSEKTEVYADNGIYYAGYFDNGMKGELEMMKFPDEFKTKYLGYVKLEGGGTAAVKGAIRPNVYIAFETKGDAQKRRGMLLNVTLGAIATEYKTIEKVPEPASEKIEITVMGDKKTGITIASYTEEDSGYATLFTNPSIPTIVQE